MNTADKKQKRLSVFWSALAGSLPGAIIGDTAGSVRHSYKAGKFYGRVKDLKIPLSVHGQVTSEINKRLASARTRTRLTGAVGGALAGAGLYGLSAHFHNKNVDKYNRRIDRKRAKLNESN
jgi:hypothetical protein